MITRPRIIILTVSKFKRCPYMDIFGSTRVTATRMPDVAYPIRDNNFPKLYDSPLIIKFTYGR